MSLVKIFCNFKNVRLVALNELWLVKNVKNRLKLNSDPGKIQSIQRSNADVLLYQYQRPVISLKPIRKCGIFQTFNQTGLKFRKPNFKKVGVSGQNW